MPGFWVMVSGEFLLDKSSDISPAAGIPEAMCVSVSPPQGKNNVKGIASVVVVREGVDSE